MLFWFAACYKNAFRSNSQIECNTYHTRRLPLQLSSRWGVKFQTQHACPSVAMSSRILWHHLCVCCVCVHLDMCAVRVHARMHVVCACVWACVCVCMCSVYLHSVCAPGRSTAARQDRMQAALVSRVLAHWRVLEGRGRKRVLHHTKQDPSTAHNRNAHCCVVIVRHGLEKHPRIPLYWVRDTRSPLGASTGYSSTQLLVLLQNRSNSPRAGPLGWSWEWLVKDNPVMRCTVHTLALEALSGESPGWGKRSRRERERERD